jgi:hypothetical protein
MTLQQSQSLTVFFLSISLPFKKVFLKALMEQYSHMVKQHQVKLILCRDQISRIWIYKESYQGWSEQYLTGLRQHQRI